MLCQIFSNYKGEIHIIDIYTTKYCNNYYKNEGTSPSASDIGVRSIFWLISALYPTFKPSDLIKNKSL